MSTSKQSHIYNDGHFYLYLRTTMLVTILVSIVTTDVSMTIFVRIGQNICFYVYLQGQKFLIALGYLFLKKNYIHYGTVIIRLVIIILLPLLFILIIELPIIFTL